jgi:dinuclear metal center YbgI/SA1388 family protein
MPSIKDAIVAIEQFAPLIYQENYDNSGLIVGDRKVAVKGIIISLDVTEQVVEEAIDKGCNLIVCHHPIIFSGLKKITGNTYVERVIIKAIKNDIAIYSAHTNLDNVYNGVNAKISEKLCLTQIEILAPVTNTLIQMYAYVPVTHQKIVIDALFKAGAGQIGAYHECSFSSQGKGTFKPSANTQPKIGQPNGGREYVEEVKLEFLVDIAHKNQVIATLLSQDYYEEKAYGIIPLLNNNQTVGAGMIGYLPEPLEMIDFLNYVKKRMDVNTVRHTASIGKKIYKVAVCGGSGSFLLKNAISKSADAYISADFKYHEFFDADNKILITDIGHFESEQHTKEIFYAILNEKFPNFAIHYSGVNTNPIHYY